MVWQQWVGIALTILATFLITRRYGTRRRTLRLEFSAIPLLALGRGSSEVEIRVRGEAMKTPHRVRISLINTGSKDVRPEDYPDSLGRLMLPGCTKMGPLQGTVRLRKSTAGAVSVGGGGGTDPTLWEFERAHIPKGATLSFTGIVDGKPAKPTISPLYDVNIVDGDAWFRNRELRSAAVLVTTLLGIIVVQSVLEQRQVDVPLIPIVLATVALVAAVAIARDARKSRRLRAARTSSA